MTAFSTVTPTPAPLDPNKRVHYTLGMVLGVDDFRQEFAYHSARDKWLARDLIGVGTVRGLNVAIQGPIQGTGTEVVVQPGVALTPHGQIVRVPSAQCAVLDQWVTNNQTSIAMNFAGSPPNSPPAAPERGTITLYTILRYKPCLTDLVPIPGEPCRSASDAMAPSRVTDGFDLELSLTKPAPTEDVGIADILGWLAQVPLSDGPGSTTAAILAAMATSFGVANATPGVPLGPPSAPPSGLSIGVTSAPTIYGAALQYYATTLRDLLDGSPTADATPAETGVLLATVSVPVAQSLSGQWALDPTTPPTVDNTRPFLLPLEMLKDAWLASVATLTRYRFVTAGLLPVQATAPTAAAAAAGPQAWWVNPGQIRVSFPDVPVPGTQYVVKALPSMATSPSAITLVATATTTSPPGCTIAAFSGATATPTSTALSLFLEVHALLGS